MYNRAYINLTNNNELYHFGRKGMKWGKHLFGDTQKPYNPYSSAKNAVEKAGSRSKAMDIQAKKGEQIAKRGMIRDGLAMAGFFAAPAIATAIGGTAALPVGIAAGFAGALIASGKSYVENYRHMNELAGIGSINVNDKYNDMFESRIRIRKD